MDAAQIMSFLSSYASDPVMVYFAVVALLTASSFGLPIPEEVTLISAGIIGFFSLHPELHPTPELAPSKINPWTLAVVCSASVFLSDFLVYAIGRYGRKHLGDSRRFSNFLNGPRFRKVSNLTGTYGAWMVAGFRFTPGLRFPGHMSCGFLGIPAWKFCAVDGLAVLISVPTQVLLIAFYGDIILSYMRQFKIFLLVAVLAAVLFVIVRKLQPRWLKS